MNTSILKISIAFSVLVLAACGGQKKISSPEELAKLDKFVNAKQFNLNARWANPLSTTTMNAISTSGLLPPGSSPNRIDIIGVASYLEFKNDSVFAQLPYYGERQFASTYNPADAGIQFEGVPEDLDFSFDEKKQEYNFKFDITNDQGEGFNIVGTIFPNYRTVFYINSNERLTIGYSGTMEALEE